MYQKTNKEVVKKYELLLHASHCSKQLLFYLTQSSLKNKQKTPKR